MPVVAKGPKDPLDRPFAGRRMSAVDQGYRYAINLPCDWVVVTSIRQIRLYCRGCDQHTYERFDTERLADDENHLKRFVLLLGAERVVPPGGPCHLATLLGESERVGRDLRESATNNSRPAMQSRFPRDRSRVPFCMRVDRRSESHTGLTRTTGRLLRAIFRTSFFRKQSLRTP